MDHIVALRFGSTVDIVELKLAIQLVASGEIIISDQTWQIPKKYLEFGDQDLVRQFGETKHSRHKNNYAIIGVYDTTNTEHLDKMVAAIIRAAGPHSYLDDILN